MTTAAARFHTALITMGANGERPRSSDPITGAMWTSEDVNGHDDFPTGGQEFSSLVDVIFPRWRT